MPNEKREFLRHTVATLAYRAAKAIRGAPEDFGTLRISETSRTPLQVLLHIGDLIDWGLTIARGNELWKDGTAGTWDEASNRLFVSLKALDDFLASDEPMPGDPGKIFQGPVADALTHVGQITMMRRIGGEPVRGENYARADIQSGRVGKQQSAPRREFD